MRHVEHAQAENSSIHWQLPLSAGTEAAWLGERPASEKASCWKVNKNEMNFNVFFILLLLIWNYSCNGFTLVYSLSTQARQWITQLTSRMFCLVFFKPGLARLLINTGSQSITEPRSETYGFYKKLFSASASLHSGDKRANLHVEEVSPPACLHPLVFGWIKA